MTVGLYGNPQFSYISWGLNYGFAYDLPSNTSVFLKPGSSMEKRDVETRPMIQRRNRRDLYSKLELIMDALVFICVLFAIKMPDDFYYNFRMGYNGRDCILRALCESSQIFGRKGSNMISEMIRAAFSFPKSKVMPFEHHELSIYDDAHRKGKSLVICATIFPDCGFSLLHLALGKYSEPPKMSFM